MKILILSQADVENLLPMAECITVMDEALSSLARGEMHQPLRQVVHPPGADGIIAMMPSFRYGADAIFGLKAICVFPKNAETGKDAHQGGVLLFRGDTGEPMAFMNASAITAIRTAAVTAVATRVLSREDASELAIIGAGVQARSHLEAIACVRKLKRARVVSRNPEHAKALAEEMGGRFEFPIESVPSAQEAILGADIIVTVTTSKEPVVQREWLTPGSHINAIGTYSPRAREIDTATMVEATLFVDRRESALNEAGDYLVAAAAGAITPNHIHAELGEVLIGSASGRSSSDEITLFKSLGLAVEDLAAADYVFRKAQREQVGTWVEF